MSTHYLRTLGLTLSMLVMAGCSSTQQVKEDAGPPPPRNLLGTTDELQLVTELLTTLISDYGSEPILVVLAVDDTLLANDDGGPCDSGTNMPQLVQPDTATQVQRMQSTGAKVIALSAYGPACSREIIGELQHHGISFKQSAWPQETGTEAAVFHFGYEDGVVLTDGKDKGLALKALLDNSDIPQPGLIIMVDYKQKDLSEVMKAFAYSGTKVHAWRYTRVDTAMN